jgi:hypothetical protein
VFTPEKDDWYPAASDEMQILRVLGNYSCWDWRRMKLGSENAYRFAPNLSPLAMRLRA